MSRRTGLIVLLAVLAFVAAAVQVVVRPSPGCLPPVQDPLDPRSLQHPLPGGPPPSYATEPPTSGPHQAAGLAGGVLTEPLSGPVQVGALEAGQVLLQHRDLQPDERARLEALAGPLVVVAPNPALPTRVVASAWRNRQQCPTVEEGPLRRFIAAHGGKTP